MVKIKEFINPAQIWLPTKEGKGTTLYKYLKKHEKDIYSTEEIKTNKVWVDDKPIYRKVVIWNVPTGTTWIGLDISTIGITNYDYIYFGDGTRYMYSNRYIKDVATDPNFYFDTDNGNITTKQNDTVRVFTIVLEYTKTTD